jgi:outer membrane receptor protein involved in Fe transport
MFRRLPAVLFLFSALGLGASDSSLQFMVRAGADRSLVPQARILVTKAARTYQCVTGNNGECWVQGVDAGEYQVEVTAPGFAAHRLAAGIGHRQVRIFTVLLDIAPVTESVQVVAQQETESPRAATVSQWRPEELQTLPYAETLDVPHAVLRLLPGATRSHDDIIHVRGAEMSLSTITNGVVGLESQHPSLAAPAAPEHFEALELATGGFAAEYGLRLGGVVDATTRSGRTMKDHGSVALGGGGLGRRWASAEVGGSTERWSFYLGSRIYQTDWFFSPPEIPALHDSGHGIQNLLQIDYRLDSKTDLRFTVLGNHAQAEFPNTREQQTMWFRDARQSLWNQRAQISLNRSWNASNLVVQFSQAYARSLYVQNDRVVAPYFRYPRHTPNGSLRADYGFMLGGRHLVKTGAEGFLLRPREELVGNEVMMLGMPNQHTHRQWIRGQGQGHIASYYLQDHLRLTSRWTLDLGLRLDHYQMKGDGMQSLVVLMMRGMVNTKLAPSPYNWSKVDNGISPRVGMAYYVPSSGTTLRFSFSRMFLPPPVENQLLSSQNFIGMLVMGVPIDWRSRPLLAARGNQFDAGVTQKVGQAVLQINLYDRRLDNAYHTMQFGASRILPFVNFDQEGAYGAEASLRFPKLYWSGLSGYWNYSAARVFYYNPIIGGFQGHAHGEGLTRFPAPMDQIHTSTGGLTWRHHKSGVWTSLLGCFSTGTPLLPGGAGHDHASETTTVSAAMESVSGRLPSHLTADWSLGVDLLRETKRTLTLHFAVENLSNSPYRIAQESSFTPAQYSIGRVFSAGLRWRY